MFQRKMVSKTRPNSVMLVGPGKRLGLPNKSDGDVSTSIFPERAF